MEINLLPPFIMREAGLIVDEVLKIHVEGPSVENHSIFVPSEGLRIPLSLNRIFSYFTTSKPTVEQADLHALEER
eukprot:6531088-Ditylum_brightwellii.AAC.1